MIKLVKLGALALSGLLVTSALALSGCGGPEGAGTVSITAAKEAAAARGIPEGRDPSSPPVKGTRGKVRRPRPTTALPKGGR